MIISISTWWVALTVFEQVYWVVAIPSSLIFIMMLILTFVGGDLDDHPDVDTSHDADHGGDHDGGFHVFTVKNIVAFFAVFAWTGLACIDAGMRTMITLFISLFAGTTMMLLLATIFYLMTKLTESGTLDMRNAISGTGDVYLSIPAAKSGLGKIQIKVQGALRTLDAMTDEPEIIKTGSLVEVVDVINENILVVRKSMNV